MNKRTVPLIILLTALLLSISLTPVRAQEDGFRETFDDPSLPGWEHSREAIVVDGVLRMSPGSYALRFGDWADITLTVRVKYSGEGEVLVNYYFRDGNRYGVLMGEHVVLLEKEQDLDSIRGTEEFEGLIRRLKKHPAGSALLR